VSYGANKRLCSVRYFTTLSTFEALALDYVTTLLSTEVINPLTPNDAYSGRTAPLNSERCVLYIYSTNTGTEYFKHGIYSPCGFGGLGVACWPLVPNFAGSIPKPSDF